MPKLVELVVEPARRHDDILLRQLAARQCGFRPDLVGHIEILKVSLDARMRPPVFRIRAEVYKSGELFTPEAPILDHLHPVHDRPPVILVGAGPAGYFAALELIEQGLKPIVLDRGKDARARRRDLRAIQQESVVNPHSNYCFGEGGAGTYSDGKLYTRSIKRGNVKKALNLLVEHGAKSDILYEAHPHIGSNKLPGVVQNIRATIERLGGEVHFDQWVVDLIVHEGKMAGVVTESVAPEGEAAVRREWLSPAVVLATGHSARDIYRLLHTKNITVEAKPFALGVRVEHPQPLIDRIQYGGADTTDLPAASYSLVCQVAERGVFSFCMCPGGLVVPAATAPGEIVVNGMSMSRRDSPFANSGVVAAVEAADLKAWAQYGPLSHMAFQSEVEQKLWAAGDGSQRGPALRLTDFVRRRMSSTLPASSYIPGLYASPLYDLLPDWIYDRLSAGLKQFGQSMRGYYTEEAVVIGTESRTSSPVRIPRDGLTLMHPDVTGLFPCGEGAGYAGGIISAAMDGQRVAEKVKAYMN